MDRPARLADDLDDLPNLLTTTQVAEVFNVTPSQVRRWADRDLLESIRTPGGHRRFPRAAVAAALTDA